jgi:hypothetical protein
MGKMVESSVVDPDSDPAFQEIPDLIPTYPNLIRIRIQGLITKIWKKIQWKFIQKLFFSSKLQLTYPWGFIKDVQATGEAFSPQKRTSRTSKMKFITFF